MEASDIVTFPERRYSSEVRSRRGTSDSFDRSRSSTLDSFSSESTEDRPEEVEREIEREIEKELEGGDEGSDHIRRIRAEKNRQYAQRSRQRKKQLLADLERSLVAAHVRNDVMENENKKLCAAHAEAMMQMERLQNENRELMNRLASAGIGLPAPPASAASPSTHTTLPQNSQNIFQAQLGTPVAVNPFLPYGVGSGGGAAGNPSSYEIMLMMQQQKLQQLTGQSPSMTLPPIYNPLLTQPFPSPLGGGASSLSLHFNDAASASSESERASQEMSPRLVNQNYQFQFLSLQTPQVSQHETPDANQPYYPLATPSQSAAQQQQLQQHFQLLQQQQQQQQQQQ